jgi:hypothetical protein
LEVRPHGAGYAVWYGGEFLAETGDQYDTARAVRRWQEQIDAGQEPDTYLPGGEKRPDGRYQDDVVEELEARFAELEKLHPSRTGREGGIASQADKDEPDWRGYATGRIVGDFAANRTASDTDIYNWLTRHWAFEGRERPSRAACLDLISRLRAANKLPPNPRGRKKI